MMPQCQDTNNQEQAESEELLGGYEGWGCRGDAGEGWVLMKKH